MINPATQPQNELNDFTNNIRVIARNRWAANYFVKLRNGDLVRPIFVPAEDEHCEDTFQYEDDKMSYCWNLDGTSVTRSDYDMMEIVRND